MKGRLISAAAGVVVVPLVFVGLVVLGVLPVRTYATQQRELALTQDRLDLLKTKNESLRARARVLQTDAEVARLAREQFGMVREGQQLVLISGLRPNGAVPATPGGVSDALQPLPPPASVPHLGLIDVLRDAIRFWR